MGAARRPGPCSAFRIGGVGRAFLGRADHGSGYDTTKIEAVPEAIMPECKGMARILMEARQPSD